MVAELVDWPLASRADASESWPLSNECRCRERTGAVGEEQAEKSGGEAVSQHGGAEDAVYGLASPGRGENQPPRPCSRMAKGGEAACVGVDAAGAPARTPANRRWQPRHHGCVSPVPMAPDPPEVAAGAGGPESC